MDVTPRVTRAHGWQNGGGLHIDTYGGWGASATLTNTNVYGNQAGRQVCLLTFLEL